MNCTNGFFKLETFMDKILFADDDIDPPDQTLKILEYYRFTIMIVIHKSYNVFGLLEFKISPKLIEA